MANIFGDPVYTGTTNVAGNSTISTNANTNQTCVLVKDFGAIGNGVVDDTDAVRAAHSFANSNNFSVSYEGLDQCLVQADAKITINTNVDFANCKFLLANAVRSSPSYNGYTLFNVVDAAAPLVSLTNQTPTNAATNLKKGSVFPTVGIFAGPGFVNITHSSVTVPGRGQFTDISSTVNYKQTFYVHTAGETSYPLSLDLTANSGVLSSVTYRVASAKRIVIQNFSVFENGFNSQKLFYVTRNNVDFRHIYVMGYTGGYTGGPYDNINQLIRIDDCGDVTISDYKLTPRMITGENGSYGLSSYNAADIFVTRMTGAGQTPSASETNRAWGCIQNENVNGFHITDSIVNRVDCHNGGFNFTVHDCVIHGDASEQAVCFGWGGGVLSVQGCKIINARAIIMQRTDYCGSWFGSMSIDNCQISFNKRYECYGIRMSKLGAPSDTYCAETISITNVQKIDRALSGNGGGFYPLEMVVHSSLAYNAAKVYAPHAINIHNVSCNFQWRSGILLDLMNMVRVDSSHSLHINISNVRPDTVTFSSDGSTSFSGLYDFEKHSTRSIAASDYPSRLMIHISDCSRFYVESLMFNNGTSSSRQIHITNCGLTGVELGASQTNKLMCRISNCRFTDVPSGTGTAVVGSVYSAAEQFTSLHNCHFSGDTVWDLSRISLLQGCTFTSTLPTFPSGANVQNAFSGWYADSVFAQTYKSNQVINRYTGTNITIAGTTSEAIVLGIQIPANSLGPKGHLRLSFFLSFNNNNANSKTLRFRIGPNNSLTGAQQVLTSNMATSLSFQQFGYIISAGGTTNTLFCSGFSGIGVSGNAAVALFTRDHTVPFWLLITTEVNDATTIPTIQYATVDTVHAV